jgi:hypothetical protein
MREPVRKASGRTFGARSIYVPDPCWSSLSVMSSHSLKMSIRPPSEVPPSAGFIHARFCNRRVPHRVIEGASILLLAWNTTGRMGLQKSRHNVGKKPVVPLAEREVFGAALKNIALPERRRSHSLFFRRPWPLSHNPPKPF